MAIKKKKKDFQIYKNYFNNILKRRQTLLVLTACCIGMIKVLKNPLGI